MSKIAMTKFKCAILPTVTFTVLLFCFLFAFSIFSFADVIELNNGTKLTCVIGLEDSKHLVVETQFGSMTLTRVAVKSIARDSGEKNLLLRGDFFVARGDNDSAMKQYTEALVQYPSSQEARTKYRKLREQLDETDKKELTKKGDAASLMSTDVSAEAKESATAHLKAKKKELVTLVLNGFGSFPTDNSKNKDKAALTASRLDALQKAFGDAVGIGFTLVKGKLTILPAGELPNYKIKVLEKQKAEDLGYAIKLQVQCPPESVITKIPEGLPEQEVTGTVSLLEYKNKDYKSAAEHAAYQTAVMNVVSSLGQGQQKPVISGRIFVVDPPVGTFVDGTYQVKTRVKVWFD